MWNEVNRVLNEDDIAMDGVAWALLGKGNAVESATQKTDDSDMFWEMADNSIDYALIDYNAMDVDVAQQMQLPGPSGGTS